MHMPVVREEKGQGTIEYALIIVLTFIILIAVLVLFGTQISTFFSQIVSGLTR